MNYKKQNPFQFHFSRVLEACEFFFANLDFRNDPIYLISDPDGQDWEVKFFWMGVSFLLRRTFPPKLVIFFLLF